MKTKLVTVAFATLAGGLTACSPTMFGSSNSSSSQKDSSSLTGNKTSDPLTGVSGISCQGSGPREIGPGLSLFTANGETQSVSVQIIMNADGTYTAEATFQVFDASQSLIQTDTVTALAVQESTDTEMDNPMAPIAITPPTPPPPGINGTGTGTYSQPQSEHIHFDGGLGNSVFDLNLEADLSTGAVTYNAPSPVQDPLPGGSGGDSGAGIPAPLAHMYFQPDLTCAETPVSN